jgi:endogenous inhibitor of DNA gyrase (YacG/DUF329 family)
MHATLLIRVTDIKVMSRYPDVKCPTCKKTGPWLEKPMGPFCGERCKLVDLGKWFNGEMVIEEPLRADHFEGYGDLPPGSYLDQPE